jgi:predicted acyltransferase
LTSSGPRVFSVDALRGFDMFWIVGGDFLARSFVKIHDSSATRTLAAQMEHARWDGFRFYDLIFPLFVWIVGVAIPLSVPRLVARSGPGGAVRRIVIRSILLFLLGVFYMGGVANGLKNVYLAGVLHRIAVAYLFAALLFIFFSRARILAVWIVVLLVGYWALLTFVPVPGVGPASYAQGRNLAFYIDQRWLPGQKFEGTLLSTLPAVANCLLGVLAGMLLAGAGRRETSKVLWLFVGGAGMLAAGMLWARQFPVIKSLWTSSYVLVACGISAMLLALFHLVTDVWRLRAWAMPFVWIGMNAITIYLVTGVVNFRKLADRIVGGEVGAAMGPYFELVKAVVVLAAVFALVRLLFTRQIFLRI